MQINILDPDLYAGNPYPTYQWLRENSPCYWDSQNQAFVVSRHRDVCEASKDAELWSAEPSVLPSSDIPVSIACMDNPRHQRLRNLINKGFTPRMIAQMEPKVRALIRQQLDRVAGFASGEFDLVREIAVPVPLFIIAEMMGIPKEDHQKFHSWSDTTIGATTATPDNPAALIRAIQAYGEYGAYLENIFSAARTNPRDDLVSILVKNRDLEDDEEALAADELIMFMTLLLVAGNETTRNAMSGGMEGFAAFPDQWELLRRNPDLLPSAVEEILRYVTPIICFRRTATRDTEIEGVKIAKGQKLIMLYQSANRDPRVFDRPDEFDITRSPNPHLAFGIGTHYCMGANLARMEIRTVFDELITRFPDLHVAPGFEPRHIASPTFRGIDEMRVAFDPTRNAQRC